MDNALYKLKDILYHELEAIVKELGGRNINSNMMQYVDLVTHSLKSIETICSMQEGQRYGNSGNSNSYGYGGDNYGEYNYHSDGYGYRGRDSRGRYTADGGSLTDSLNQLKGQVTDPQAREQMEKLIQHLNSKQ